MCNFLAATAIAFAALSLSGCFPTAPTPSNSQHTSENSLDWQGRYGGVLPCADCPGIETFITLDPDLTYQIRTRYLGRDDRVFEHRGRFAWEANGNVIQLQGIVDGPDRYHVGENQLFQLDRLGKRITGALADQYVLRKLDNGEAGILHALAQPAQWEATELIGRRLDLGAATPWIRFEPDGSRLHGFGGCNHFSGSFELAPGNRIRFAKMAATLRACLDTNVEAEFLRVLVTADSYHLNDQELVLHRARMAPLVRFRATTGK